MTSETSNIWEQLSAKFPDGDIEWRVGRCGRSAKGVWAILLPYLTGRAVMSKLDEVVGPENWRDEYIELQGGGGGMLCKLSVCVDGNWITKEGCASYTHIEAIKGGESVALKRAAVKFGIGRYLYDVGDIWADNIEEESRPPSGMNTVSITSKDPQIRAWCPYPSLNPAPQAEPERKPFEGTKVQPAPRLDRAGLLDALSERGATKEQGLMAMASFIEGNGIKGQPNTQQRRAFFDEIQAGKWDHIWTNANNSTVTDDDIDRAFTGAGGGLQGVTNA